MSYTITPIGTATGPNWQYQLERDTHFSDWFFYPYVFTDDPESGPIRAGVTYYLYARNLTIGEDVLVAPLQVTSDNRVVSIDATGSARENTVCGSSGEGGSALPDALALLGSATDGQQVKVSILNGKPVLVPVAPDTLRDVSLRQNLSGTIEVTDAFFVRNNHQNAQGQIDGQEPLPMSVVRASQYILANATLEYIALFLHNGKDFLGLDQILANGDTTSKTIRLTGNANLAYYWDHSALGLYFIDPTAPPGSPPLAFIGFTETGKLTLSVNQKQQLQVSDDRVTLTKLLQGDVPVYVREFGVGFKQLSDAVSLPLVYEYSALLNEFIIKEQSQAAFQQALVENFPTKAIYDKLDNYAKLGTSLWIVDEVCYYDAPVPPPTSQTLTLTSVADNTALTHTLETAAFAYECYGLLSSGLYKRTEEVGLTSPSTTGMTFYNPTGSAWTGKIKLTNANNL